MIQYLLIFFGVAVAIASLFMLVQYLDRKRIQRYLAGQGYTFVRAEWEPFGSGWFGDDKNALYRVTYLDHEGSRHSVHCKTGMFSGVYFTLDETRRSRERK